MRCFYIALAFVSLLGCTDRDLYGKVGQEPQQADKVTFTGVLCTDNPATRKFPVKIMFIVDISGGMNEAAINGEHANAIEAILNQYLPIPNVQVGFIAYGANATSLISERIGTITSGFTRDDNSITNAVSALRTTGGNLRDLQGALSLANSLITGDAFQAELGPLTRTKYVVVHLVTGSPLPPIPRAACDGIVLIPPGGTCEPLYIEQTIRNLRQQVLDLGAAELTFHTVHIEATHVEGEPCDPRMGSAICPTPGTTCIQAGARADVGRCVQLCDPANPICTASPLRPICANARMPNGTIIDYCARGELDCFDGMDNDRDGQDMDCGNIDYPYTCRANDPMFPTCEVDCLSTCRTEDFGLSSALSTGGRYLRFESADQINLSKIDFRSTQRLFVLKEFLVYNKNAIASGNTFIPDSDADGLSDAEEGILGLDPLSADTDGDYYNDRLEHLLLPLGLDPQSVNTFEDCDDPTIDTDGDGLYDCEEKLLGSNKTLFDTDADGFPDLVEFRVGTNMLFNDNLDDIDLDGVNNGREIRAHSDALSNDSKGRSELSYRYRATDLGPTTDFRSCYDFRVSNVTLVNTLDRGFGPGINDIEIYFGQVPEQALEKFGLFHVAQVRIQYLPGVNGQPDRRIPDTPSIDLDEDDFAFFEQ